MDTPDAPQYLVVEDLVETRHWLIAVLTGAFGGVPAGAGSLAEARQWFATERRAGVPLLALVDLGLPDGRGTELIAEIAATDPLATMVVTTIFEDDESLVTALGAGAAGYLLKDRDDAELARRLKGISAGEVPISPAIARRLLARFRDAPRHPAAITPRETDVLRLIGRGMTIRESAQLLGMSEQTAATHVKSIYRKLDIGSRAEAALEAQRRGLA